MTKYTNCSAPVILAFLVALIRGVASMTIDEAILEDIMFNQGSANCQDTDQTDTTFIHTPSPSTWWDGLDEKHNFLAEMTHSETDLNKSWTVRFGKGGSIYSMIGGYGEAIPPQETGVESAWVDEVIQAVAVDIEENGKPMPHYIHQAGTYLRDSVLDKPFYSPNVAKHCEQNTCSFGTWGQIAAIPNINESDAIFYHKYSNCGNGVMEYIQMFTGDFGNNVAFLNMPWAGVRTSSLPDLYMSNIDGEMKPKRDPILGWGDDEIIDLEATGGFSTFGQNGQQDPALSYVHGTCEEYEEPPNSYFRAKSRLRFGLSERDFTVFTINGRLTVRPWLGEQIYVNRQYIISDQLGNIGSQAQSWVSEARGDMLTLSDFTSGRTLELYSDDNAVFGAAAASSRGGTSTSCDTGTIKCSGKTVPTNNMVPIFAISCGNLNFVGSNKYFFSPDPDENDYIRSYVCDGQGTGIIPEWKLLGYFPDEDCDSLSNAAYDPSFCIASTDSPTMSPVPSTDSPTFSPTDSPTLSPTNLPSITPSTIPPTDSPTFSSTHGPTFLPTDIPSATPITSSPTDSPTFSPTDIPSVTPSTSPSVVRPRTDGPTFLPTDSPITTSPIITPTCRNIGSYYYLKHKYCKKRANNPLMRYARFWKIKPGEKEDVLDLECKNNRCNRRDCCVKGPPRKCSNTGRNGPVKGGFTQKMCGKRQKLFAPVRLNREGCTRKNGYLCSRKNCCRKL